MLNESGINRVLMAAGLVVLVSAGLWLGLTPQGATLLGAATGKKIATKSPVNLNVVSVDGLDPRSTRVAQLDTAGVEGLLAALEARGAKVELSSSEEQGFSFLNIKVDGQKITPLLIGCRDCEPIVYEY